MTSVRHLLLIAAFAVTASAHAQEKVALPPPGPPNQGVHPLGVLILVGVAAVFGTIFFFLLRWAVRLNRKNNRGVVEHLVQSRPDLPAEVAVRLDAAWRAAFLCWLAVGLLKMGAVAYLVLRDQTPRNPGRVGGASSR
jgi:heme/copper-type cytochrome/quinol oxidase subunit 2